MPIERLEMTRNYKLSKSLEELMIKVTNQSSHENEMNNNLFQTMLLEFVTQIKKLSFQDEPDYLLLKQILLNAMQLVERPSPQQPVFSFETSIDVKIKIDDCKLFDSVMFKTNDCSEGEHMLTTGNCTESDELFIDDFQEKS